MKLLLALPLIVVSFYLTGCDKKHNCVCSNPGGSKTELVIVGSKIKADRKCKEYYQSSYGDVPFNETSCEIK